MSINHTHGAFQVIHVLPILACSLRLIIARSCVCLASSRDESPCVGRKVLLLSVAPGYRKLPIFATGQCEWMGELWIE